MAGQEIPPCGGTIGNETAVSRIQSPKDPSEEHLRRRKSKFKVPEMRIACNLQGTERRTLCVAYVRKEKVVSGSSKDHIRERFVGNEST